MEPYLTPERYEAITGQTPPADFILLLTQAQIVLDRETGGALQASDLPHFIQQAAERAAALEVLYLDSAGGLTEAAAAADQVSLGKFSYTSTAIGGRDVGPGVREALLPTGLLYRGCAVN